MSNKRKMILSVIGFILSTALLVATATLAEKAIISSSLAAALTIVSVVLILVSTCCLSKIDYETGVYECRSCGHTFKPAFKAYIMGAHTITTRYIKCPQCGESTWCKRKPAGKGK